MDSFRCKYFFYQLILQSRNSQSRVLAFSLMSHANYKKDFLTKEFLNSVTKDVILT